MTEFAFLGDLWGPLRNNLMQEFKNPSELKTLPINFNVVKLSGASGWQ